MFENFYGIAKANVMEIEIFRPGEQLDLAAFKRHVALFFSFFVCFRFPVLLV